MKKFATGLLVFCFVFHVAAGYLDDFQSALQHYEARDWTNAASAFSALAETSSTALQDRCQLYVVRALAATKDREAAFAAAERIRDPHWRAYARMAALETLGQPAELLQTFRDEPIQDWPDSLAYLGFLMRGTAAGLAPEARPDLKRAAAEAGSDSTSKGLALNRLVSAHLAAGDSASALATAERLVGLTACRGKYFWIDGVFQKARLLSAVKRFDEAESTLELMSKNTEPIFRFRYLEAQGDLALARERHTEAEDWYSQALELPNVNPLYPTNLRKKLGQN